MEEFQSVMWKAVAPSMREGLETAAANLMRDAKAFEAACIAVIERWPNSTGAAMTTPSLNYQAWIGHAACTIHAGSPEDVTRQAWRTLTKSEQDAANAAAQAAVDMWRFMNA